MVAIAANKCRTVVATASLKYSHVAGCLVFSRTNGLERLMDNLNAMLKRQLLQLDHQVRIHLCHNHPSGVNGSLATVIRFFATYPTSL
jgi:hypothetical protein